MKLKTLIKISTIFLSFGIFSYSIANEVYSWKDKKGTTVFSSTKPNDLSIKYKVMNLGEPTIMSSPKINTTEQQDNKEYAAQVVKDHQEHQQIYIPQSAEHNQGAYQAAGVQSVSMPGSGDTFGGNGNNASITQPSESGSTSPLSSISDAMSGGSDGESSELSSLAGAMGRSNENSSELSGLAKSL